jgi:hypothetical protein
MDRRWIWRIPIILLAQWVHVSDAADTPARMLEGKYSVENQLRVRAGTPKGRYRLSCESIIKKNGRTEYPFCYVGDESELPLQVAKLVAATQRALRYAHFAPATRDGAPTDVYMVLMARIDVTDQGPLILVVPNNGVEQSRYGLLYTAPQRLNDFHLDLRPVSSKPVTVWQKMYVDENGKVSRYEVMNSSNASAELLQHIKDSAMRTEFIAGHVDGKPVGMWYMEPVILRTWLP